MYINLEFQISHSADTKISLPAHTNTHTHAHAHTHTHTNTQA